MTGMSKSLCPKSKIDLSCVLRSLAGPFEHIQSLRPVLYLLDDVDVIQFAPSSPKVGLFCGRSLEYLSNLALRNALGMALHDFEYPEADL